MNEIQEKIVGLLEIKSIRVGLMIFGGLLSLYVVCGFLSSVIDSHTKEVEESWEDDSQALKSSWKPKLKTRPIQKPKPIQKPISEIPKPTKAMVRVHFFDLTEKNPIEQKAEIWFRSHGSWWLKRGTDAKNLGYREIGVKMVHDECIVMYPEGRKLSPLGTEIARRIDIPIKMTKEMNPEGSHRDAVTIIFYDTEIEIWGLPFEVATGKTKTKLKR